MGTGATAGEPPLIALSGRRRGAAGAHDGPAALDALEVEVYFTGYAEHVAAAGGLAVHAAAVADPGSLVRRIDALVLTGGNDVEPSRYGGTAGDGAPPPDPERDAHELALLDAALAAGRPVLAICRGLQLVNVAFGGTLHPHLTEHRVDHRHEVAFAAGSVLRDLHGPSAVVNSLHHQGVDRIGTDLVVTGRAPDGVVEGLELPGGRLVAVQWHPEQLHDAPQPVFRWLVDVSR